MTTEERIGRLERINRRLTVALGSIVLAASLATAMGAQAKPGPIDATAIHLVDQNGRVQGVFGVTDQEVVLSLGDKETGGCVKIGAWRDGSSGVHLFSRRETPDASLMISARGTPIFNINDRDGRPVVSIPRE